MILWQLIFVILFSFINCKEIEQINDNELINLLNTNDHILVYFSKQKCNECVEMEKILLGMKNDIKDLLETNIKKIYDSDLLRLYNPKQQPSLIFFRKGIPLLYYGKSTADDILDFFVSNKDPVVKELSDETFEHLTQATTGSTTGDWFVIFSSPDCNICSRLQAVWEGIGATFKRSLSVAKMDRSGKGKDTAKRFNITTSPSFILIRQGRFYRYTLQNYDIQSLIDFILKSLENANAPSEPVPPLKDVYEEWMQGISPSIKIYSILTICMIILLIALKKKYSVKKTDKKM